MKFKIVTDGSSLANGTNNQVGGWAFKFVNSGRFCFGGEVGATNNRMEIMAVIMALENVIQIAEEGDEIQIISDSAYVVNCINQDWIGNWVKNGWLTSKKEPVKNEELWRHLARLLKLLEIKKVSVGFEKIKGHAGDPDNEFVDKLAKKGATEAQAGSKS